MDLGPDHNPVSSAARHGTVDPPRWVTIWSRFPLAEKVSVRDPSRTAAALYDVPGECPLLVYGTVIPWKSDRDPQDTTDWAKHHRVIAEQADEWSALRERYPGVTLCVAGDLNMTLGHRIYYGTKAGVRMLSDGLAAVGLVCATATDVLPDGALDKANIDHVCLPISWAERARLVSAWKGTTSDGVRLSDHGGLVVEVDARRNGGDKPDAHNRPPTQLDGRQG